ncbi:uncharacterized protein LOC131958568 [Physella acuta]|uniref:uncharacterized protein LOC131958568 n=1 Tax=Physella acuta TaxID=109671 RepID=UPI0027DE885F|nr:uncharacterized protein LOC131958568 [Physella acuta]
MNHSFEINTEFLSKFKATEEAVIGIGSTAKVVLATSVDEPDVKFAVKKFTLYKVNAAGKRVSEDSIVARNFYKEVEIMKRLKNPSVIQLVATVTTHKYLAIVMPYCRKGALSVLLPSLTDVQQTRFSIQLTEAVKYLHTKNVIHGDIKPPNVLVDGHDHALLADFGLSRVVPNKMVELVVDYGTRSFRAPETFRQLRVNPFKADVYSLGVTLWSIALKKTAFFWIDYKEEITKATLVPIRLRKVVLLLLQEDPNKRPSATDILLDL